MPKPVHVSVDVARGNTLALGEQLAPLVEAGAACYCVFADGHFAPQLRGDFGLVAALRRELAAPVCVHLLAESPQNYIDALVEAGATSVLIQLEATAQPYPILAQLREAGVSPGLALNPATALTKLEYLLPLIDRVLLLGRESGDTRAGLLPITFDRVRILAEFIQHAKQRIRIDVTHCDSLEDAARLVRMGADGLVLGDAILAQPDPAAALQAFRNDVAARTRQV